jgi:hypothetical protein
MARKTTPRKTVEFHGQTRKGGYRSSEYATWTGMIQRCINPDAVGYARYGGRGVKVCRRWQNSVVAFLQDMGRKPSPLHSIERKNNNGNYEPGNCVWAIRRVQTRNRSTNNNITAFGKTFCVTDWAKALGIEPSAIAGRIERGWTSEDAVSIEPEHHERTYLTIRGETMTPHAWAKRSGIADSLVRHRLRHGWEPEEAVFGRAGLHGVGRKPSKFLVVDGISRCVEEWAVINGVNRTTIDERLKRGWSNKDAVRAEKGTVVKREIVHGTLSCYGYHRCRCDLCKNAKRASRKSRS